MVALPVFLLPIFIETGLSILLFFQNSPVPFISTPHLISHVRPCPSDSYKLSVFSTHTFNAHRHTRVFYILVRFPPIFPLLSPLAPRPSLLSPSLSYSLESSSWLTQCTMVYSTIRIPLFALFAFSLPGPSQS
ncbi:hypothetical protein ACTXT7_006491 [Hymenolepis weldensis]